MNAEGAGPLDGPAPTVELAARGLAKTFGGTAALRDVDFVVNHGEVHALLGGNGSGKSTLIKILAGVHQADAGQIEVAGRGVAARHVTPGWAYAAGLRFVHQDTGIFLDHTVAENFALGSSYGARSLTHIDWRRLNRRVAETLRRFDLDVAPDARMGSLRKAEQTMVAVARALDGEAGSSVLILDEPTASLPPHEVGQMYAAIRGYLAKGHTVVLVSHRIDDILAVATHATFLRDGRLLARRPIAGLDERAIVAQMSAGEVAAGQTRARRDRTSAGEPLLQIRDLSTGALREATFDLYPGEILGISGLAGSGRSSLLRGIADLAPRRAGEIRLAGTVLPGRMRPDQAIRRGITYVPEDRTGDAAFRERSVRENLVAPRIRQFWRRFGMSVRGERRATTDAIARYDVKPPLPEAAFSALSGGNQQKVVLARWLELAPRVVLLDEPTQGVDVGARQGLHDQVRAAAERGLGVIVVSSDPRELAELADRVLGLKGGRITGELRGDAVTPQACVRAAYGIEPASVGATANGDDDAGQR